MKISKIAPRSWSHCLDESVPPEACEVILWLPLCSQVLPFKLSSAFIRAKFHSHSFTCYWLKGLGHGLSALIMSLFPIHFVGIPLSICCSATFAVPFTAKNLPAHLMSRHKTILWNCRLMLQVQAQFQNWARKRLRQVDRSNRRHILTDKVRTACEG